MDHESSAHFSMSVTSNTIQKETQLPLETATFIPDLVTSNPAHSDGLNQTDAHLRLIKSTIKNTFPNFTDAALQSTQAQLDAGAAVATTGAAVLAEAGAFFKTNTTDGITNPAAGEIDLEVDGTAAVKVVNNSGAITATVEGALNTTGPISGPGITPIGGMIMWLDTNLPTTGGAWCWANGGVLSRTQAGAGLELFQEWSRNGGNPLRFGAGDGSTTFNVINMNETVPIGASGMGGAASRGLVTASGSSNVGSAFGEQSHTLVPGEIPTITGVNTNTQNYSLNSGETNQFLVPSSNTTTGGGSFGAAGSGENDNIGVSGFIQITPNTLAFQSTNTGGGAHNNLQPSTVVNFIIRIA